VKDETTRKGPTRNHWRKGSSVAVDVDIHVEDVTKRFGDMTAVDD
jgi:hypothetical protein